MAVRAIDAVQVLHNINLHRRPTPVSEFESGFNNGLNQAMWEITQAPTLTQPNEPLTLEELREMDGQPVWVDDENDKKTWALLQVWGDENIDAVFPMPRGCFHAESVIGKKIYRCPPEEEI